MSKKMKIKGNQNTQVAGDLHSNHFEIHLHTPEAAKAFAKTLLKKTDIEKVCLLDRYLKNVSSGTTGLELAFLKKITPTFRSPKNKDVDKLLHAIADLKKIDREMYVRDKLAQDLFLTNIDDQEQKKLLKRKVSEDEERLLYSIIQKRFKETLQLCSLATLKKALKLTNLWDFMPTEMYALVLEAFLKKPKSNSTEIGYGF